MPRLKSWSICFKFKENVRCFLWLHKTLSRLKVFSTVHKLGLYLPRVSTTSEICVQHFILQYNHVLIWRPDSMLLVFSNQLYLQDFRSHIVCHITFFKKILQCYWLTLETIYRKVLVEVWRRKTTNTNLKGILQKRLIYFHQVLHQKYLQKGCWLDESHQVLKRTKYSS